MRFVCWDTETHLIKKGNITPRLVCVSWAERETPYEVARGIFLRDDGIEWVRNYLEDDGATLVGHNVAYDFGVVIASSPPAESARLMRLVFEKYEKGLVHDTQIRQQLIDIATGELKFHEDPDTGDVEKTSYHLSDLSYRLLKKFLKKKDTWRLRYAALDGVPLAHWPEEAVRYAIDDAVTTLEVHEKQSEIAGGPIPNSSQQHRAAFALHLMSVWGVRTDGAAVAVLKDSLTKDFIDLTNKLRPSGLLNIIAARVMTRGARKGQTVPEKIAKRTKAIQAKISDAFNTKGLDVPKTEPSDKYPDGQISTAKKTLLDTGDPDLKLLAERGGIAKLVETYIPILESGTIVPINARYNVLVETGRVSCSKPNLMNPPRAGGVRASFIPRDGWVFAFSDYDTLELRALAQCCLDMLGHSEMAQALRRGEDLHLSLAAELNEISYTEAKARSDAGDNKIKEDRQFCKIPNFGYPGGLSANSFVEYAEGFGYKVTSERAHEMRDLWFKRWPEMRPYFNLISDLSDLGTPIVQNRSGRIRGGASFCAIANGFFQGLAADGAKDALWFVAYECYTDASSPLFGCRPVLFIHDEIAIEIPYRAWGVERSARAADRLGTVMIDAMRKWIPDVPISAKPVIVRRWLKGADPVKVDGVLVPSKPVVVEKDGKKKTTWVADI